MELFIDTIVREVVVDLRGNCFFKDFRKEWEVGDWADIVEVAGVSSRFLENGGYCS